MITTAMSGSRIPVLILSPIQQMVIGYYLTMAGHGYPITNGDGHRSIMDVGISINITDGFGYPTMNGVRHG